MKKLLSVRVLLLSFFALCTFSSFAAPGNDACSAATTVTPATSCTNTTGDLYQAASSTPASIYGTPYDVWYKFVVPSNTNTVVINMTSVDAGTGLGSSLNANNMFIEAFNA